LLTDGTARCWGRDLVYLNDAFTPVPVSGLAGAVALASGQAHNCALLADGRVVCWGYNPSGQLGDGTRVEDLGGGRGRLLRLLRARLPGEQQSGDRAPRRPAHRVSDRTRSSTARQASDPAIRPPSAPCPIDQDAIPPPPALWPARQGAILPPPAPWPAHQDT